jgi:Fic family protein
MKLAFESLRDYIQRKILKKQQITDFIRIPGINTRQALILKWYNEEPSLLLTVKEIQNWSGVSNQTTRNDLQGLSSLGFLEQIQLNAKKEAFVHHTDFNELINRASGSVKR